MKTRKVLATGLLVLSLFLIGGCGKVPKLTNGQDAVVSLKDDKSISIDDLYNKIKSDYALEALITLVDTTILETEFADFVEEAKSYAKSYVESMIKNYGGEKEFIQQLQYYTNYSTIDGYQDYIYLSYLQSHAVEEYAKTQITDKQIKKYYKDTAAGDIEVSHILITVDAASDATADEKTKAEEAAKAKINEIIEKLNNAKETEQSITDKFTELAKEYSKDDATKDKGGSLGKINVDTLANSYDELVTAAYKLKDGEYSTSLVTTELGYHVILRTKSYEKDTLENMTDSIRKILSENYMSQSKTISVDALEYYRDKYDMKIEDSELDSQFDTYIKNMLSSLTQENTESN